MLDRSQSTRRIKLRTKQCPYWEEYHSCSNRIFLGSFGFEPVAAASRSEVEFFFVNTCSSFFKCQYPQRRRVPIQSVATSLPAPGSSPDHRLATRQCQATMANGISWAFFGVKTWYIIAVVQLDLHPKKHVRTITGFDPHL